MVYDLAGLLVTPVPHLEGLYPTTTEIPEIAVYRAIGALNISYCLRSRVRALFLQ